MNIVVLPVRRRSSRGRSPLLDAAPPGPGATYLNRCTAAGTSGGCRLVRSRHTVRRSERATRWRAAAPPRPYPAAGRRRSGVDPSRSRGMPLTDAQGGWRRRTWGLAVANRLPTPAARVWAWTALLVFVTVLIWWSVIRHISVQVPVPFPMPWPLIALGIYVAEVRVVQVHFRRETHSFSLSEVPSVMGLFLLSPTDYLLAVMVGSGAALLLHNRAPLIKIAFNLANYAFLAVVSVSVFHALSPEVGRPDPVDAAAAVVTTVMAAVLAACSIATVISLSGRRAAVPQAAGDDQVRRPGRAGQLVPRGAGREPAVVRPVRCCGCSRHPSSPSTSPTGPTCRSARSTSGWSCSMSPAGSSSGPPRWTPRSWRSWSTHGTCSAPRSPSCTCTPATSRTRSSARSACSTRAPRCCQREPLRRPGVTASAAGGTRVLLGRPAAPAGRWSGASAR